MVLYAYNPTGVKAEEEDLEFKASLGCIVKLCREGGREREREREREKRKEGRKERRSGGRRIASSRSAKAI
jgi:hypothetical protein